MKASETWKLVNEKLEELRGLVDQNWSKGEWQLALSGEHVIKTVEESRAAAADLRSQTDKYFRLIGYDPDEEDPLS